LVEVDHPVVGNKIMKKLLVSIILTLAFTAQAFALAVPAPPFQYVRDDANIFSRAFEKELDATIAAIEDESSSEIGVLTVTSLEDEALEDYATEVFREWGIGQEGIDNGLLLLIAVEDRSVRIEVGYGLEGRITDLQSISIINSSIGPAFKEERYEDGVRDAIQDIGALIHQEFEEEGFSTTPGVIDDSETIISALITVGIWATLAGILQVFALTLLPIAWGERLKQLPTPHVLISTGFLYAGAGMMTWVIGLIAATAIYGMFKKYDIEKAKKGGGGGTSGSVGGARHYKPPTKSSGSVGKSGSSGRKFGGGSSGGGGASGKW